MFCSYYSLRFLFFVFSFYILSKTARDAPVWTLRVYVDGIARIICDLTRTTTVHDIIIALAQYKGKAGRYSLIERAPDGTQRTLSPNELTNELIHHPDWSYILRQNSSNDQKRSKSLDERKTSLQLQQQSSIESMLRDFIAL